MIADAFAAGDLTIANADASETAEALGIAVDDAVESVNSGALGRQSLSRATLLSSLNGGKGVTLGDVRFTDSRRPGRHGRPRRRGSAAKNHRRRDRRHQRPVDWRRGCASTMPATAF